MRLAPIPAMLAGQIAHACDLPLPGTTSKLIGLLDRGLVGYVEYSEVLDEVELLAIGVTRERRRQGHGRTLLQALLDGVPDAGRVFLEVRPSNAAAIGLYARFGFAQIARRRGYYKDGEDALIYSLTR